MAYEQRDMSGSLFKNKRADRDTSANLTGTCKINGVEMWVNAWTKTDKNGEKWISLSFREKQPRQEYGTKPSNEKTEMYDVPDDSIPF